MPNSLPTRRRATWAVATAGLAFVLMAAGCGGDDDSGATAGSTGDPAVSGSTAATPETATSDPGTADPGTATTTTASPATDPPTTTTTLPAATAADPLQVLVLGDSVVWDASPGIQAAFESTGAVELDPQGTPGVGLTTDDPAADWRERWSALVADDQPHLVILMTGGWDVYTMRTEAMEPAAYQAIVEETVDLLTAGGAKLLIVGMAPQQLTGASAADLASDDALRPVVNGIFAAVAAAHPADVAYLDLDPVLGDAEGNFTRYLPGADGVPELVRKPDGLHVCPLGAIRLGEAMVDAAGTWWTLPPVDPAYRTADWRLDARYDDPPGACVPEAGARA